jgi:hypothetical protein
MLVRKIFFDPFFYVLKKFLRPPNPPPTRSPTIFGKKIKFEQGIIEKKIIDTARNFEKIIVHAGNGPPPPPSLF